MTVPPKLFDQSALRAHRARARPDALFLHETALVDIQDRLDMVNRVFTKIAIVTPFAEIWSHAFPRATFVPASETLEIAQNKHDLVIHAMALHWSNDPVGQLIQCRRALKADGLFLGVLLGGRTLAELRAVLSEAEIETTGGLSPRVAPMTDMRAAGGLLQRAGLALPVSDNVDISVEYRDLWHVMHDLRAMGETNAMRDRLRRPTRRAVFRVAQEKYDRQFGLPNGNIPVTFEMVYLTGWSPSENQPRPLRPGSAKMRLSEALGTDETNLPD